MTQTRSSQAATLAALLVAFILVGWGIGALVTSAMTPADLDLVRDIASDRTAAATVVAQFFSWIGSGFVIFPLALACCVTLYRRHRRASALAVALSTVGAQIIIDLDKLLVGRHRPPLHHLARVTGHSFPSGHTGQTAALCAVLVIEGFLQWGSRPRQFAALAAGGLLVASVAFSRVYLGVHYPSDVIAGAVLGACWSLVASRVSHLWSSADERSEIRVGGREAAWARGPTR
jgi:membrane-associated phospholipid phosphatase